MEEATPSRSSLPLISRLDQLDFLMKYLERKQEFERRSSNCYAGDLAVKEVYSNGSLLDRVASLEHRLSQLSLEIESSRSSSQEGTSKVGESSCSFPTLSNNIRMTSQFHYRTSCSLPEIQETCTREQKKMEHELVGENIKSKKKEKSHRNGKKRASTPKSNWPHFKLLGC